MPRRHYFVAIARSANTNRGALFSDKSVSMRCCRPDESSVTNHLHYLTSGGASFRVNLRRQEFFLPVVTIMKALLPEGTTDREVYDRIVGPDVDDTYIRDRALSMIKDAADVSRESRSGLLVFLATRFRVLMSCPSGWSDTKVGKEFLRRFVFVHLSVKPREEESPGLDASKVDLAVLMIRKLLSFVRGDTLGDNPDAMMFQEVLLPGHLYTIYLREKIEEFLRAAASVFRRDLGKEKTRDMALASMYTTKYLSNLLTKAPYDLTKKMEYFLATGNLQTTSGLNLMQTAGYSIVAERINFWRFIAHFRCVHRGQFFTEVRSTSVRKLLPDAWGFVCPVHTPDGAPCGKH